MKLNDLPDGASAFVDANIFVYHFSGVSPECRAFLERVEQGRLQAVTGAHILLETLHRLMMLEALNKGLITPGQPAKKLKQRLDVIPLLSDYQTCVTDIRCLRVRVYPINLKLIRASQALRAAYGLMTNDSVAAAMMLSYQITNLVSLDSDMQRVPGLTLYQPTDINT